MLSQDSDMQLRALKRENELLKLLLGKAHDDLAKAASKAHDKLEQSKSKPPSANKNTLEKEVTLASSPRLNHQGPQRQSAAAEVSLRQNKTKPVPPQPKRPFYAAFGEALQRKAPAAFALLRYANRALAAIWRRRIWTIPAALIGLLIIAFGLIMEPYRVLIFSGAALGLWAATTAYIFLHILQLRERLAHEIMLHQRTATSLSHLQKSTQNLDHKIANNFEHNRAEIKAAKAAVNQEVTVAKQLVRAELNETKRDISRVINVIRQSKTDEFEINFERRIQPALNNIEVAANMAMIEYVDPIKSGLDYAKADLAQKISDLEARIEGQKSQDDPGPSRAAKDDKPQHFQHSRKEYREGHHLIDPGNKVLYCYIAKNMCSTMKFAFLKNKLFEDGARPDEATLQRDLHAIAEEHSLLASPMADFSDYYSFCIVRDPYERMASVFNSKFVRPATIPGYAAAFARRSDARNVNDFTFADFIDTLTKTNVEEFDEHWMPQYQHLIDGVDYDFIPMESVGVHAKLSELYGTVLRDLKINSVPFETSAEITDTTPLTQLRARLREHSTVPAHHALLSEDIRGKIDFVYAEDVKIYKSAKSTYSSA